MGSPRMRNHQPIMKNGQPTCGCCCGCSALLGVCQETYTIAVAGFGPVSCYIPPQNVGCGILNGNYTVTWDAVRGFWKLWPHDPLEMGDVYAELHCGEGEIWEIVDGVWQFICMGRTWTAIVGKWGYCTDITARKYHCNDEQPPSCCPDASSGGVIYTVQQARGDGWTGAPCCDTWGTVKVKS